MKVLELHGYQQTGERFHSKTGSLRRLFPKNTEFTPVDAFYRLIPIDGRIDEIDMVGKDGNSIRSVPFFFTEQREEEEYGWWGKDHDGVFIGIPEALAWLMKYWGESDYDGIVAFSQGATMAAILCAHLLSRRDAGEEVRLPKFVILSSIAFLDQHMEAAGGEQAVRRMSEIPMLLTFGEKDAVLPFEPASRFAEMTSCHFIRHPAGHCIPNLKGELRDEFKAFLANLN